MSRLSAKHVTLPVLLSFLVFLGACTGSTSEEGTESTTTTTDPDSPPTTVNAVELIVNACRQELLQAEPSISRLALDPAVTGMALSIPIDDVPKAAEGLYDCLGDENGALYLATDLIASGEALPEGTADCLQGPMAGDGATLLEVSLQWTRLEQPERAEGEVFIDALVECVPGRFLAAPLRTENPAGYELAVDEDCLDGAHSDDGSPMRAFWEFQTYERASADPATVWTDAEAEAIVAPLYNCVQTGKLIAADPNISVALTEATTDCISEVAEGAGFWESRLAARPFDQGQYEDDLAACLTPEEALSVLGVPIPEDDPDASSFNVVDQCYDQQGSGELAELLETATAEDITTLANDLAPCAEAEGVAGRYSSVTYRGRALPQGSYDCFLPKAEANPTLLLESKLFVEAGQPAPDEAGRLFIDAMSTCVPPVIYTLGLLLDYSGPSIAPTIDSSCIDEVHGPGSAAATAYWQGITFGGFAEEGELTSLATDAMGPIYSCVDPGMGFAAVADEAGVELSDETIACINDDIRELQPLELSLIGGSLEVGAFNGAIAECLSPFEVEALRG